MRPFTINDVQNLFDLDVDPEVHVFLGNNPVKSLEESELMLQSILAQYRKHQLGRLAIIRKEDNQFIGWAGIKLEENVRDFAYYDLGYRLKKQFWGQGIATEAAKALLEYGFQNLKLETINAAAEEDHTASNKVLNKIGMRCTQRFIFDNSPCNWYTLQKKQWLKSRNPTE